MLWALWRPLSAIELVAEVGQWVRGTSLSGESCRPRHQCMAAGQGLGMGDEASLESSQYFFPTERHLRDTKGWPLTVRSWANSWAAVGIPAH